MTLNEFLLARIAEDEAAWSGGTDLATRPDFARLSRHMLADCAAKRAILTDVAYFLSQKPPHMAGEVTAVEQFVQRPLHHLAQSYADHPDYRDEWRP